MRVIIRSEKWVNPRTMADLVSIGNNKFWFSKGEIIAYEINGTYKVRGLWGHNNHYDYLPSSRDVYRIDSTTFKSNLLIKFYNLYDRVMSAYHDEAIYFERFAGSRANAFVLTIGRIKLYFSQGNFIAYKLGDSGPLHLCENWIHDGTVTKHTNALVPKDYPRIERGAFLRQFIIDVPEIDAASRMEWCD